MTPGHVRIMGIDHEIQTLKERMAELERWRKEFRPNRGGKKKGKR